MAKGSRVALLGQQMEWQDSEFESALTESTSGSTLASKQMWGELYGKGNHVEAGALLQYSLQSSNEMIMYSGTAILSE